MLPFPPSVNMYWRSWNGRNILSTKGREFRKTELPPFLPFEPTDRLWLLIELYPPDHRRRDCDNFSKGILDLLQHAGVYADDSQIDELIIRRKDVIARPGKALVFVGKLDDPSLSRIPTDVPA